MLFKKLFTIERPEKQRKRREEKTTVSVGMRTIPTTVVFMDRTTISVAINTLKGELIIKLPYRMTMDDAFRFAREKEMWLIRKLSEAENRTSNHLPREYKDGSKHTLLGKVFTLRVVPSNKRVKPLFEEGVLTVYASDDCKIERAVKRWYADNAPILFSTILAPILSDFTIRYGKTPKTIEYKYVTSYWGVCTSRGCIRLNIELLRAPKECIEYIISHELCHLVHPNHSTKFYTLLTDFQPDWRNRKKLLEQSISCRQ